MASTATFILFALFAGASALGLRVGANQVTVADEKDTETQIAVNSWAYSSAYNDTTCTDSDFFGLLATAPNSCDIEAPGADYASRFCHSGNGNSDDYLEACFASTYLVTAVKIQKGYNNQYITGFRLTYKDDANNYHDVDSGKEYSLAYTDCVDTKPLVTHVRAKCMRVYATAYHSWKSYHVEFRGHLPAPGNLDVTTYHDGAIRTPDAETGVCGWRLVRFLPAGSHVWHPVGDDLAGTGANCNGQTTHATSEDGKIAYVSTPVGCSAYGDESDFTQPWSVNFGTYDEYVLGTCNHNTWVRIKKDALRGGESSYVNKNTLDSSTDTDIVTYRKRSTENYGPDVFFEGERMYMEYGWWASSFSGVSALGDANGGMCVFVRDSSAAESECQGDAGLTTPAPTPAPAPECGIHEAQLADSGTSEWISPNHFTGGWTSGAHFIRRCSDYSSFTGKDWYIAVKLGTQRTNYFAPKTSATSVCDVVSTASGTHFKWSPSGKNGTFVRAEYMGRSDHLGAGNQLAPDGSGLRMPSWGVMPHAAAGGKYKAGCCDPGWGTAYTMDLYLNPCKNDETNCVAFSEARCRAVVAELGLQLGGAGLAFAGDYGIKGCYAYGSNTDYNGMAFYGTGGTNQEMSSALGDETTRYRPQGYDTCPTSESASAAKGDPHLMNVKGEAFDVMQTGNMMLLEIPRGSSPATLDLALHADIERLGVVSCGPTFITSASIQGRWIGVPLEIRSGHIAKEGRPQPKHTFAIRFDGKAWFPHAEMQRTTELSKDATLTARDRMFLFQVRGLDIAVSQPKRPRIFLDIQVKGLGKLKTEIGGLLGIDDHSSVEELPPGCEMSASSLSLFAMEEDEALQWSARALL